MNWTERYRPKKFQDIVGQEPAVWEIKNFIEEFYLGNLTKKRPLYCMVLPELEKQQWLR